MDLAYLIIFFNSSVFPDKLIRINKSWFVILPRSPWEQSLADTEKDGQPTEDNVADIFEAIFPLLPTPQIIIFDLHFVIAFTADMNGCSREFLNFLSA